MIGFGSIGKGTLPLIERHIAFDRARFVVIAPDDSDRRLLDERQIRFIHRGLTEENYREILTPLLTTGPGRGMLVNLSVDTSSVDLMEFCKDLDAFYIDTVVEPWPGLYTNRERSISERSNYALRESVLDLRRRRPGGITAVSCCGANPGMVSWMVKQALIDICGQLKLDFVEPAAREDWARLMQRAGVKGIHIAERDTQRARDPKPRGKFVNTWSVEGIDELGVLLYGHAKNAYWYGSQLSIEETRRLAPYQNATGLQVTSAVLAGIVWMLENPERGIVEADEMDFRRCLDLQRPYLGPVIGCYTDWTPLVGRSELFPETLDTSDPWQFSNVLVN